MKKIVLIAALVAVGLTSCNKKAEADSNVNDSIANTNQPVIDEGNSQTALDWAGTYEGVLPCADCEGIQTIITLNSDDTFTLSQKYLGKDNVVDDKGSIMWHDGTIVHLKGTSVDMKLKVGENQLFFLDQEGKVIDGPLKEKYILTKK